VSAPTVPTATYRLQLHAGFGFREARAVVPYLAALGISHVYCSPYLKARSGSTHGYDIVDHNALNPELGSREDFEAFVAELRRHDMGHILDLVPNHMGVGGDDNAWWLDVLENGPASRYAAFFDIDWAPVKDELRGKVLLPFLGDRYGAVLERGELVLGVDAARGELSVHYHNHRFPLDPTTYPQVLGSAVREVSDRDRAEELDKVIAAFQALPPRTTTEAKVCRRRDEEAAQAKRRLAALCATHPGVRAALDLAIRQLNGKPERPASFDALHRLLETQAYRLAYWQVASDEINYRRFFDINDLAGLCMDQPEVFESTHRLVLTLVAKGQLNGLRIDHPDGLRDPLDYYRRLDAAMRRAGAGDPPYIVIEKVLAHYEHLPHAWPVRGTTGYEFSQLVDGLFVWPQSQRELDGLYARFIGQAPDYEELVYRCKKLVIRTQLSSELTVLANMLDKIAERDRQTRDYTLNGLREALTEIAACFPVYRTYVTTEATRDEDRQFIDWAVAQAKRRSPTVDPIIFDFVRTQLLLEERDSLAPAALHERAAFVLRFQQYTAPVMAKAVEDTAFYRYHRLVSLNEVGGDPSSYGRSPAALHAFNREHLEHWPATLLATSTHDSKRSEDVRARINVLSELPQEWRRHVGRWSRVNRSKKLEVDGLRVPSRNDEYLLYQTLLGVWPPHPVSDEERGHLRERVEAYMIKAVREAKEHSSWLTPNEDYEQGVRRFIERLFAHPKRNPFLTDFLAFQARIAPVGLLNSLSRTIIKLTAPGVPDIYQGNELWRFDLVDPDNRRPIDYAHCESMLSGLPIAQAIRVRGPEIRALCQPLEDGRAKLFLTHSLLQLRRQHPGLFIHGDYLALDAAGPCAEHIVAFTRQHEGRAVLVCAPRWYARLAEDSAQETPGLPEPSIWSETVLELPEAFADVAFQNSLTGERVAPSRRGERSVLEIEALLSDFPVAALLGEPPNAD